MSSQSLVDPELLPVLEMFSPEGLSAEALPAMREAMMEQMVSDIAPLENVSVEEIWIPSHKGEHQIRALVYRPQQQTDGMPALLDIHGGGYVVGAPEMCDTANRGYAALLGAVVVSVDYRLAPETAHPGPVEDCYSALKWIHDQAQALSVDTSHIGIIGSSAGGGLAAALALLARDRKEVTIAFQSLLMPMLDDRTVTRYKAEPHPFVGEFIWTMESNHFGWSSLLGCEPGSDGVSPYASAARAEDLSGLPPTFISVGALDLFVEENLEYARRLIAAGVSTEIHVYPGAFHGYSMLPDARVSQQDKLLLESALIRALCQ